VKRSSWAGRAVRLRGGNGGFRLPCSAACVATGLALALVAAARAGVSAVDAIGITVSDMERSLAFYTEVLQFRPVHDAEVQGGAFEHLVSLHGARARVVRLGLGAEYVDLVEFLAPEGRRFPEDTRSNDLWFQHIAIVVRDMDEAYGVLERHGVRHGSTAPQRLPDWNPNAGGIEAFYFRDLDGHHLEVLAFPKGKGDPKWHRQTTSLFLGIDHTAIVVSDTDASLAFYRDALGMEVVGGAENYGVEQEHLNNVFGARLRITTLRAERGPGVELLEYLAPRGGRPYPLDTSSNDLWHWQTEFVARAETGEALAASVRSGGGAWRSPGVVALDPGVLGFGAGFLACDPDGHAIRVAW